MDCNPHKHWLITYEYMLMMNENMAGGVRPLLTIRPLIISTLIIYK